MEYIIFDHVRLLENDLLKLLRSLNNQNTTRIKQRRLQRSKQKAKDKKKKKRTRWNSRQKHVQAFLHLSRKNKSQKKNVTWWSITMWIFFFDFTNTPNQRKSARSYTIKWYPINPRRKGVLLSSWMRRTGSENSISSVHSKKIACSWQEINALQRNLNQNYRQHST